MKLLKASVSFFFLAVLFASVSSAANVAYVYEKTSKINQGFVNAFQTAGHTVSLVKVGSTSDFSPYDLIFIGDEKIRNPSALSLQSKNLIISSHYNSRDLGLTDSDGVSKLSSSAKLKVSVDDSEFEVYTSSKTKKRISASYFYLDNENKMPSVTSEASVMKTSSGKNIGAVVAYKSGANRICFFGIMETKLWTQKAKELFNDCISFALGTSTPQPQCLVDSDCPADQFSSNFCSSSNNSAGIFRTITDYRCQTGVCVSSSSQQVIQTCNDGNSSTNDICLNSGGIPQCQNNPSENPSITCTQNSDCGTDGFIGENFCSINGNVVRIFKTWVCSNAGTSQSYCDSSTSENQIVSCQNGCSNGICLSEQTSLVHDVTLTNFSGSVDRIRLEETDGTDILAGQSFVCNTSYRISITAKNIGNYTENISFAGTIGSLPFDHNLIENQEPGSSNLRTRTVNFTLPAGNYPLTVNAILNGSIDANPSDNTAVRNIQIVCP